jgi:hypothetical protein
MDADGVTPHAKHSDYRLRSTRTFIIFRKGARTLKRCGVLHMPGLMQFLNKLAGSAWDPSPMS